MVSLEIFLFRGIYHHFILRSFTTVFRTKINVSAGNLIKGLRKDFMLCIDLYLKFSIGSNLLTRTIRMVMIK